MKIAFFGTPDFAVATLKHLVEHKRNIVAVFTSPDKPAGRGQKVQYSDVKQYALEQDLPLYQPEKLKNKDFVSFYKSLDIDIAVVVAFRMMPKEIWGAANIGTLNLHGSLLPNYRGAAPINWAIMNGEKKTGVTTFFINENIDTGDILLQKECDILPDDTFGTMYGKLKILGASLVKETLDGLEAELIVPKPQPNIENIHPAPKITREILEITDFSTCEGIDNKVRGLIPVYKPFVVLNDKKYIIKNGYPEKAEVLKNNERFETDGSSYLRLKSEDGYYYITEIQAEGKKPMDIKSFFNGNSL